jgi:hypothetical protein
MLWRSTVTILLIFLLSNSCKQQETRTTSSGKSGELVIVMPEQLWSTSVADAIQSSFGTAQYGLPQAEPLFRLVSVNKKDFKGLLLQHRNIFIAEIEGSEPKLRFQKDVWARPQIVIKATAPDSSSLQVLITTQANQLVEYFNKEERARILSGYTKLQDRIIEQTIKDEFNLKLVVPEGYYIATHAPGFIWLRRENPDVSQGLFIYERHYDDTLNLSKSNILKARDSITTQYIPGPEKGSYMVSEMDYPVSLSPIEINNNYALEMRGLWKTRGYFMGGPFINYSIIDNKNNRIVTLDGFVFAPRFNKREYLRQLEAIIYSADFQ